MRQPSLVGSVQTMSPAALSVLEFLGARIADNDIRIFAMVLGFMAMRDKDDHKSPAGGNGAASAKSPTQVSRFTENVPPKVRDAGGPELSCWINEVPLTLDGRFIADGGNDGHRTSLRKEPLGQVSGIVAGACPG